MMNKDLILHGQHMFLEKWLFLQEEVFHAFLKLQQMGKHDGFSIEIVSGYRNFSSQLKIWNEKAKGLRPLYNRDQKVLQYRNLSNKEIVDSILIWSAIPGFSRHHWGTDIDIFDSRMISSKSDVQLLPSECDQGGPFYELHKWLDEKIKTNDSFGFFRPYDKELGGVSPEKWHLSYYPIAEELNSQLTIEKFINCLKNEGIELKEVLLENPDYYFKTYVKNISLPAWEI